MSTLNSVSPELEQFVVEEVFSGRLSSREAVISHAIRLLQREGEEAVPGILTDTLAAKISESAKREEQIANSRAPEKSG